MLSANPIENVWCALHVLHINELKPSLRTVARKSADVLGPNGSRGFNAIGGLLRVARAVYQQCEQGVPVPEDLRDRAIRPPDAGALRAAVAGINKDEWERVRELWNIATHWHESQQTDALARAADPGPSAGARSAPEAERSGVGLLLSGDSQEPPLIEESLAADPPGAPSDHPDPTRPYDFAEALAARLDQPLALFGIRPSPSELWEAFRRDLEHMAGSNGSRLAATHYRLALSPGDCRKAEEIREALSAELARAIEWYAPSVGLACTAPVVVEIVENAELASGVCGIRPVSDRPTPAVPPIQPWSKAPLSVRGAPEPRVPGYHGFTLVGKGSTSKVYRAIHDRLGRADAIKVLLDGTTTEGSYLRELRTSVDLAGHPHIVTIYDSGVTPQGEPYIVMEYCEQGSYAGILRAHGPLAVSAGVEVGRIIAGALHAAHGVGIIHRDVKPSNILRSRFGPLLADFGIARAPQDLERTGSLHVMTPSHASPEMLMMRPQSATSDVYGLASTLWQLLTGFSPFEDPARPVRDVYELRDRVLNDPLPAMPRADVPYSLVRELSRALAKSPEDRHESALAFGLALLRAGSEG